MADLMDTKQAARYLGINEKKIYYLAKTGTIPCTRVTGKWIFPKKLLDDWIERSAAGLVQGKRKENQNRFLLGSGSDDPSLGIMRDLYASQTGPASLFTATVGSTGGLAAVRNGIADFALSHLFDSATGEYNFPFLKKMLPSGAVVALLFYRELGLVVRPGNPKGIETIGDLSKEDLRMVNRQEGSGTRHYLDQELARLGINSKKLAGYDPVVSTHLEVGLKILRDEADAGLATKTVAQMLGLGFVPLTRERFDILIPRERFFSSSLEILLGIIGSREFRSRVEEMGGYDVSESGRIMTSS